MQERIKMSLVEKADSVKADELITVGGGQEEWPVMGSGQWWVTEGEVRASIP